MDIGTPTSSGISLPRKKDILDLKNDPQGVKYLIFMVGLPARGKSYICKKLAKYMNWAGFNCRIFNVGNRRRAAADAPAVAKSSSDLSTSHDAGFFDPDNPDASSQREKLAAQTLEESIDWLNREGKIAIHDATNSTLARRSYLWDRVSREKNIQALFIESICPDPELLEANIKMKLEGPDYKNMDPQLALQDFNLRIKNYEKSYQTISDEEEALNMSYIKIINVGRKVIAFNITGYVPSQCVFYLMQMNIAKRTIWLTRHGESEFNLVNKIGGDPNLTARGRIYAKAMFEFVSSFEAESSSNTSSLSKFERPYDSRNNLAGSKLRVFTSTLQRAIQTGEPFDDEGYDVTHVKFLNEINSGNFDSMSYEEIEKNHPQEFAARSKNKLMYRYPGAGGESYADVIERLKPIIIELERMRNDTLVVSHNVTMRTLLAYFTGAPLADVPKIQIPLHTLYSLQVKPYGADISTYQLNEESLKLELVSTHKQ